MKKSNDFEGSNFSVLFLFFISVMDKVTFFSILFYQSVVSLFSCSFFEIAQKNKSYNGQ